MTGTRQRVGFYVHHEGMGHMARTMAIAAELETPVTILSSLDLEALAGVSTSNVDMVQLPPDVGERTCSREPNANGALHWAPLDPDVLGPRARTLVDWLTSADVAALVCDVSVEAAVLARLCGVAPIVVREHGRRTDDAHTLAHRIATGILAPFPHELESSDTPRWLRERSFHAGFISAPRDQLSRADARTMLDLDARPMLLVVLGAGSHSFDAGSLRQIAGELEGWQIVFAGAGAPELRDGAVRCDGWVPDVRAYLAATDVVVGTAGSNLVAEVAAAGRPFICVPQDRPFDEQRQRSHRLQELHLAIVRESWPGAGQWAPVVAEALSLGGDKLAQLAVGATPALAADWICRVSLESGCAR